MNIIDKCVQLIQDNERWDHTGRRYENRAVVTVLHRAWSMSARLSVRGSAGHWEKGRFITDLTQPIYVWVYGQRTVEVNATQRTVTIPPQIWWNTARNVLYDGGMGLNVYYHHATPYDPGGLAVRAANGAFFTCDGFTLHEEAGRLVHPHPEQRMRQTVISPESTAYVRHIRARMHDAFLSYDMLRRGTNPNDPNAPFSLLYMEPFFATPEHGRVAAIRAWMDSGEAFDADAYAHLLACIRGDIYYRCYMYNQHAQSGFKMVIQRASNALRREKYFEYV